MILKKLYTAYDESRMPVPRFPPFLFSLAMALLVLCIGMAPHEVWASAGGENPQVRAESRIASSVPLSSQIQAKSKKKTGWVKKAGKRYYLKKGKAVKGWQTIKGKQYYFSSKGVLQTNKIAGNSRDGYAYVDLSGVRIQEKTIQLATGLVLALTDRSMSRKKKLDTCYSYFVNQCSYLSNNYTFSIGNFSWMGSRLYEIGCGDCYQSALAMTYCARALGFTARFAQGKVSSIYATPVSEHGWCEVKINGKYLVYDITMKRYHTSSPLGGQVTRGGYPFALACDKTYYLHAKNGKTFWKVGTPP